MTEPNLMVFFSGLLLGFALIISLGPQNIFLIRQGALRQHALLSATVCFCCDIILMGASIAGLHQVLARHPNLTKWFSLLGALFLFYYGHQALASMARQTSPHSSGFDRNKRVQIIAFALGFSLLNPQAIIDSMLIIGSSSSRYSDHLTAYTLGVLSASLLWFFTLTLTAYHFSSLLTRPKVWSWLNGISGGLMLGMGLLLLYSIA
ncbi:MAG: LysE family transporter [Legionellaceae bacterium]|nr:LysE family transporter [Legionellaceae bacterium]